jgi:hypothetical protein
MLNPYPSTATKAQVLDMVFEELGRAGYDFDRQPSEEVSALRKMDALLSQWQAQGCALNYNFPATFGQSLPTDKMGVPDAALDTIAAWVAMRVAPGSGKSMSPESRKAMADGKAFLFAETSTIPEMTYPKTTAIGIGWKPWAIWYPFSTEEPADTITLGDLALADSAVTAGNNFATTISNPYGAVLALTDTSGRFTLTNGIITATALPAGTYSFTVRQTYPGATNSPYDTMLTVVAS